MRTYYCVESFRNKFRESNGLIGSSPSHFCLACKHPIHSTCGTVPEPSISRRYASGCPGEGSGARKVCSECHLKPCTINKSLTRNEASHTYLVMDDVLPKHVQSFTYSVSQDQPVRRSFNHSVHIACTTNSNPFMEAEIINRQSLILPGIKHRSFCADHDLQISRKQRNAANARRYRARHKKAINQRARTRYSKDKTQVSTQASELSSNGSLPKTSKTTEHSGDAAHTSIESKPCFLSVRNDMNANKENASDGQYHVHTVTDVYEVRRSFHIFKRSCSITPSRGAVFRVQVDSTGDRVLLRRSLDGGKNQVDFAIKHSMSGFISNQVWFSSLPRSPPCIDFWARAVENKASCR